jgi:acyl carrier protein
MGLDTVELVMEVEETFHIQIPDADASKLETVGMLCDYVAEHAELTQGTACLSSRGFYQLRRALMNVLGVPRYAVRLDMPLNALLPIQNRRRKVWRNLRNAAVGLPPLECSGVVDVGSFALCLLAFVATAGSLAMTAKVMAVPIGMLASILVAALLFVVTSPLAVELPSHCRGVRSAALHVASKLPLAGERIAPCEVELRIRTMVAKCADVPLDRVTRDSHFVRDLFLS